MPNVLNICVRDVDIHPTRISHNGLSGALVNTDDARFEFETNARLLRVYFETDTPDMAYPIRVVREIKARNGVIHTEIVAESPTTDDRSFVWDEGLPVRSGDSLYVISESPAGSKNVILELVSWNI